MTLEDLKIVTYLAKCLHFHETSVAFLMSPSNLTRRIRQIELELGVMLFDRDNRNVRVNPEAASFFEFAAKVAHEYELTLDGFRSPDRPLGGELRIYCSVTASYGVLPPLLKRYREVFPSVQVRLETGAVQRVLDKLQSHDADIGIMPISGEMPDFVTFTPVNRMPLVVIAAKEHADGVDWDQDTVLLPEGGITREVVDDWFLAYGIFPKKVHALTEFEGVLSLVSAGYGVGVVPYIVWEQSQLALHTKVLSISNRLPRLKIGIFSLKKRMHLQRIEGFFDGVRSLCG